VRISPKDEMLTPSASAKNDASGRTVENNALVRKYDRAYNLTFSRHIMSYDEFSFPSA